MIDDSAVMSEVNDLVLLPSGEKLWPGNDFNLIFSLSRTQTAKTSDIFKADDTKTDQMWQKYMINWFELMNYCGSSDFESWWQGAEPMVLSEEDMHVQVLALSKCLLLPGHLPHLGNFLFVLFSQVWQGRDERFE